MFRGNLEERAHKAQIASFYVAAATFVLTALGFFRIPQGAPTNATVEPSPIFSRPHLPDFLPWLPILGLVIAAALYATGAKMLAQANQPSRTSQEKPIWWLFGIGRRLHQQEGTIQSLRSNLRDREYQLAHLAQELQEKDETIRRQQEQILNNSRIREVRERGQALVREGNLLLDQVTNIRYDDVPTLSSPVERWVRQVYDFANRPPLICGSEIIVGLNLEPGTISERRSQILEGMLRAVKPEDERARLRDIVDRVSTRLSDRLSRLPVT